jgi:hypothetical protein
MSAEALAKAEAVPPKVESAVGIHRAVGFADRAEAEIICLGTEAPLLPVRYSVLRYYGPLRLPLSPLLSSRVGFIISPTGDSWLFTAH